MLDYSAVKASDIMADAKARHDRLRQNAEAVLDVLRTRRAPQKELEERFCPKETDIVDVPVMRYGIAVSDDEVLKWAESLDLSIPTGEPALTFQKEKTEDYLSLTRTQLFRHLRRHLDLPKSVGWMECITDPEHTRVLSLYTNYDYPIAPDVEHEIDVELRVYAGLDSSRTFAWYWDFKHCGLRYHAPWPDCNISSDEPDPLSVTTVYFSGIKFTSPSWKEMNGRSTERGRTLSRS
ncbi:hypothetical protein PENSPDRAFT_663482 [Peniophora sp. CONT]|nr:hypothetical protein PENSPDRAFT_663482 [Peniophora sp. CONT]